MLTGCGRVFIDLKNNKQARPNDNLNIKFLKLLQPIRISIVHEFLRDAMLHLFLINSVVLRKPIFLNSAAFFSTCSKFSGIDVYLTFAFISRRSKVNFKQKFSISWRPFTSLFSHFKGVKYFFAFGLKRNSGILSDKKEA